MSNQVTSLVVSGEKVLSVVSTREASSRFRGSFVAEKKILGKHGDFRFIRPILSEKEAMMEARRCLGCSDHPCTCACPVGMDVPKFIADIARGDFLSAGKVVFQYNPLALSCGILCPTSELCRMPCKTSNTELGSIRIGRLQQFAATKLVEMELKAARSGSLLPSGIETLKIACIGAGPASLSCATHLARIGFLNIEIFEESNVAGGTIAHEIPAFRIPPNLLQREVDFVRDLGVKMSFGLSLGRDFSLDDLFDKQGFDAVFVGIGLMSPKRINEIDEASFDHVYTSKDFLRDAAEATKTGKPEKLPKLYGHVVVIGAGDVAVDCSLTALRCGAEHVSMMFRRSFTDMRCNQEEFDNLKVEGVELIPNAMPKQIVGYETVKAIRVEMSDKKDDHYHGTGQQRDISCDFVITALGSSVTNDMSHLIEKFDEETLACTHPGVFAGGDMIGASTMIVEAVADGRVAAWSITRYLCEKNGKTSPTPVIIPFTTTLDAAVSVRVERDIEDIVAASKPIKKKALSRRIESHPVVKIPRTGRIVQFYWNGELVEGLEGEMISTALIAAGHDILGRHGKDNAPQGIYCANGQCSACEVVVDGIAVKSCMTPLMEGMEVKSGLPSPPIIDHVPDTVLDPSVIGDPKNVEVLVIGGGPAGMAASRELGKLGIDVLLIDDKSTLGGKLVLQTHKFFGSVEDTRAGTRGMDIGKLLAEELSELSSVRVQLQTTAVGVFSDKVVGLQSILEGVYHLVRPKKLLVATGSREKALPFKGNTLPGVYGAGAFQTILNRDFVRPAHRVLIVGGGNVGLITGYHAIQADIEVVALVEALPECGGYKVHEDKLRRLGVPILTRHSILAAHGTDHVEAATICAVDDKFQPIAGTEIEYDVDCVLVAVGLAEVNEFYAKARQYGMDVYSAGDAQAIAEASAAMITGRIEGLKIAQSLGYECDDPKVFAEKAQVLRLPGGNKRDRKQPLQEKGMRPIFHCYQEIPCDVCRNVCTHNLIYLEDGKVSGIPQFAADSGVCEGCMDCVAGCSGLAITLFDSREDFEYPLVTLPFEIDAAAVAVGKHVPIMGENGALIGNYMCMGIKHNERFNTDLVTVQMPRDVAFDAVGVWQQDHSVQTGESRPHRHEIDDPTVSGYVCRCERVTVDDIKKAIDQLGDAADINQLKAITRLGMGACGGKTCSVVAARILAQYGKKSVEPPTNRPLIVEIPMGELATAPTPIPPPSLRPIQSYEIDAEKNQYDVIVIGAGSVGVPIAMSLAESGKRVVVVDQGASPGQGDNKHAIGGIRATMSHPAKIVTMLRSLEIFRTWKDLHGDEIEWKSGGYLFPCYTEKEANMLKGLLPTQRKFGLNIGWQSKEAMVKLVPGIIEEGLLGGMYSPEDGSASPMLAINAFYRHAMQHGAVFKFREKVTSIMRNVDNAVTGIVTQKGGQEITYYAPTVVMAAGARGNEVLRSVGRKLPMIADSHEAGITEPVDGMFDGMIIDLRPGPDSSNFYFYQNIHGQFVFCITPDPPILGYDEEETSQFLPQVSKRILRLVPRLATVSVRRVWRGLYNNTPDSMPLVGFDESIKGLVHADGFGGHGFMLGPGIGEFVTRLILEKVTEEDNIVIKSFDPFREFKGTEALK